MKDFPPLTRQPVEFVDGTPDNDYPVRILKTYRINCDCKWATDTAGNCEDPVFRMMNEDCDKRAAILDRAIAILELAMR